MAKINVRDRNKGTGKKPNWEYRFEAASVGGKRRNVSKSGFKTKKKALEAGAKALADYNATGVHFEPSQMSMQDYLNLWFEKYCQTSLSYRTQKSYRGLIDRLIIPRIGLYRLNALRPITLQDFVNTLAKEGYARNTIISICGILKSSLNYAVLPLEFIASNPAQYIKTPSFAKPSQKRESLSPKQMEKILSACRKKQYKLLITLGWSCGMRMSEALGLTWDKVDLKNCSINIERQLSEIVNEGKRVLSLIPPKYGSARQIKIPQTLANLLEKVKEKQLNFSKNNLSCVVYDVVKKEIMPDGKERSVIRERFATDDSGGDTLQFVCADEFGHLMRQETADAYIERLRSRVGINFVFHTLRHSHATLLIDNNVMPKIVQQRLGHKNLSTTLSVYVHNTDGLDASAMQTLENVIGKSIDSENRGQIVDKTKNLR